MLGRSVKIPGWMLLLMIPCSSSFSNVPLEWGHLPRAPKSPEIWEAKRKSWLKIPLLPIPPVNIPSSQPIFPVSGQYNLFLINIPSSRSTFPVPGQYFQSIFPVPKQYSQFPGNIPNSQAIFPVPSQFSQFPVSIPTSQSVFPIPSQYSQSFSSLDYLPLQPQASSPKNIIICQEMLWMCLEF